MRVLQALNRGLQHCLAVDETVYLLGEDILDPYGGAFKVSAGLSTAFPDRVITTPVSEAGIVGVGVGMALRGLRPIVEIMFGDFLTIAADQLVNHAAKLRWMSADRVRVPLVVRTPMGGRRGYGPTHSQSLEKLYMGIPGIRIVAPTSLGDPAELLEYAVRGDNDPTLFVEHKLMYAQEVTDLSADPDFILKGGAQSYPTYRVSIAGAPKPTLTILAYGYMADVARGAQKRLAYEHELFAELVIPTQISPLEAEFIHDSVSGTHAILAVEEGSRAQGWTAGVLAQVLENMDGQVKGGRVAARDYPIPAAGPLEEAVLPSEQDVIRAALELVP